jgi:precorrin-3B methylase
MKLKEAKKTIVGNITYLDPAEWNGNRGSFTKGITKQVDTVDQAVDQAKLSNHGGDLGVFQNRHGKWQVFARRTAKGKRVKVIGGGTRMPKKCLGNGRIYVCATV